MQKLIYLVIIFFTLSFFDIKQAHAADNSVTSLMPVIDNGVALVYSKKGDFEDVKDELVMAIEDQGAVVSYVAHSSEMLERTALTLNIKTKIYDKAEIILFCKAEISHKMLTADPHNLVLCPYPIAVYSLADHPETIYLSVQKPPLNKPEYVSVHNLLLKILKQAIDF